MRWVIVHYSAAHPCFTWLCVTSVAICNITTITLVPVRMQYAKLLFFYSRVLFCCTLLFVTFISFVAEKLLWNHSVCSPVLISQMQFHKLRTDIWAIFTSEWITTDVVRYILEVWRQQVLQGSCSNRCLGVGFHVMRFLKLQPMVKKTNKNEYLLL